MKLWTIAIITAAVGGALSLRACAATVAKPVLPKPTYANSFCLFPIDEAWHVRKPGDSERLTKMVADMRRILGPERLYAHLGVAIISEGDEPQTFELARKLGIGLVLQGGAIEHHSMAWGFDKLFHDPKKGDRRFAQWFQDGLYADPGKENDFAFGVRACSSIYARPVYELRRAAEKARSARVAKAMRDFPNTVLACSGPIECEMHQGNNRWGDYSPFTIEEFRDYLTHRGIYAPGGRRAGLGYPGGERFADDPSPAVARGNHASFNDVFGTHFTTWTLRYWDPVRFPGRVPLDAPGLPAPGTKGYVAGGFDAPRVWPGEAPSPTPAGQDKIKPEGSSLFWEAWAGTSDDAPGFREKLLNFWVRDHTRWLAEAGIPRDRIFSHQIPGESYGLGRLSRGGSAVWTADTPHGSIGITAYFGATSDVKVFTKIVARNRNWGIFEYHPHPIDSLAAPVSEYLHSLYTCIRFRAHILTPIAWNTTGKDFIVKTGPFAKAIKQVMASLPDQPYYNHAWVDYAPPAVRGVTTKREGADTVITWSPRIWPDLRFTWSDWHAFAGFQVRDGAGKVLARTTDCRAEVKGAPAGLRVVAVKHEAKPRLPVLAGVQGYRGRLRWDECYDFFCDHYKVEVFDSAAASKPVKVATTAQARYEVRLPASATTAAGATGGQAAGAASTRKVWCRVAACDAAGASGPFSPLVAMTLPPAGRRLADLGSLHPQVTNSPDCGWRDVSVGGMTQPSLFEHPPLTGGGWARAEYKLSLPHAAAGQHVLLLAEIGIKDGATGSDGVVFRVEADGRKLYEATVKPDGKWHPVQVDLTPDAGREVTLALMTNMGGNSVSDWAAWGDPMVMLVGKGVRELPEVTGIVAQGKEVRGRVTLRWLDTASDGSRWGKMPGFAGFRVYRGADRHFAATAAARLGETKTTQFVDNHFDGSQTFYRVTAYFDDGSESPPSQAIQYAP